MGEYVGCSKSHSQVVMSRGTGDGLLVEVWYRGEGCIRTEDVWL